MGKKGFTGTVLTVGAAALLLAGCGGGNHSASTAAPDRKAGDQAPAAAKAEPVTLRVSSFAGSQTTIDNTNKVISLFEKKYPNIKVEVEYANFDSYFEKMSVQAASNSLPDVIRQDYLYLAQYARKNLLLSLDDMIKSNAIDMTDVNKVNLDSGVVDGKLYGINVGNNALTLIYDPAAFDKAGVAKPTDKWTWDDYEKAATEISRKAGVKGAAHMDPVAVFPVFLRENGKKLFNADGTGLGYDDDKLFVDYFGRELRLEDALTPIAREMEAKGLEDHMLPTGQAAMEVFWTNNMALMESVAKKPLGMAMIPGSGDGKGMFIKPSQFLSIPKSTKHPKEAAEFVDFWMNDIESNKLLNAYFGLPFIPKVVAALKPGFSESQKKASDFLEVVQKYASPIDAPNPTGGSDVVKLLQNTSQEIYFKKISVNDAAAKFRKQAEAILAKNKK
jgi:multiple sugar transport system substrate-binding protein